MVELALTIQNSVIFFIQLIYTGVKFKLKSGLPLRFCVTIDNARKASQIDNISIYTWNTLWLMLPRKKNTL